MVIYPTFRTFLVKGEMCWSSLFTFSSARTSQKAKTFPITAITRINVWRSSGKVFVFLSHFREDLNLWTNFSESFKCEISPKFILWDTFSTRAEGRTDTTRLANASFGSSPYTYSWFVSCLTLRCLGTTVLPNRNEICEEIKRIRDV